MNGKFLLIIMIVLYSVLSCNDSVIEEEPEKIKVEEVVKVKIEKKVDAGIKKIKPKPIVDPPPIVASKEETERVKLIGRMGKGIYKWKSRREAGTWVSCGERHDDGKERAMAWAYQIVTSAKTFDLNPWQFAGVAANESGFDECSLGLYPRKLAYKKGYLEKNRHFLSYKKKDIMAFYNSPIAQRMFSATGMDVGPWQILSGHWHMKKYDIEEILSLEPGTHIAATYASKLRGDSGEECVFKLWRPSKIWYFPKIKKKARKIGANEKELHVCKWNY